MDGLCVCIGATVSEALVSVSFHKCRSKSPEQ